MNKHTVIAGPTGLARIRSLVAFRHQNPVARLISVVVAFAIAMLLVLGSGAAYAEDSTSPTDPAATTTDPAAGTDTAPAADTSSDTPTDSGGSATPSDAPADTSSTAGSSGTSSDSSTGTTKTSLKKTTTSFASVLPTLAAGDCFGTGGTLVGTFEIDGNTCVDGAGNADWASTGTHRVDGAKDNTAYTQGDAERDNPAGWHTGGSSQGKDDITDAWSYTNIVSGDVWTFFGVQRVSDNGTTTYDVELNHNANSPGSQNPDRTAASGSPLGGGDLLLQFSVNGTGPLTFDKAYQWTARADFPSGADCFGPPSPYGFGWCPLNTVTPPAFESDHSADGLFAEGAIDLSALARVNGNICTGSFGQMNLRTVASEEHTAALQDYVLPFDTNIGNTCGSIVINKYEGPTDSTLAGGAHFTISPDPTPGSNDPGPVTLIDGGTGDADGLSNGTITIGQADPGQYTVVETQAPACCFLPPLAQRTQQITLQPGAGQVATFNFHDPKKWQALNVTKDGSGSYTSTYHWSIEKGVAASSDAASFGDSLTQNVPDDGAGDTSASFAYQVKVTQGARNTSHIQVTGNLYVDNPNNAPVDVTLSDDLAGASCSFADDTVTVPANAVDAAYAYTCTYPDDTDPATFDTTNVGSIAWSASVYPQDDGNGQPLAGNGQGNYTDSSAPTTIAYTETAVDKTVTVHDDRHDFVAGDVSAGTIDVNGDWVLTWTPGGGPYTGTYSRDISAAPGTCHSDTNTATLSSGGSADATATVCVGADLNVSKVSKESLTRSYLWDITKTNTDNDPLFVDPNTGHVTTHWDITVAANGKQDGGYLMSGTITVTNPNNWEDVVITGLSDSFSGGGDCTIDNWANLTAAQKTIPQAGSKDFDYTCTFNDPPATLGGTNTATVTWNSATAHTPTGTDDYDLTILESDWKLDSEINKQVTVTDGVVGGDPAVQIAGPFTWSDGFHTTFEYTVDLGAPAGECQTWTNTAHLLGDAAAELDTSSDTVEVCNGKQLTVDKTAAGHFDRTYHWSLDKRVSADPASDKAGWTDSDTWTGPEYSHIFGYRVTLSQLPWTDSNFTITGSITLTNPNSDTTIPAISSTITDAPDVGADASCFVDGGTDDGKSLAGYVTAPIASGDSLTIGYLCTVADLTPDQYTGGDNSVTATNASDSPATAPVTFTKVGEFDKTVTVVDDKVTLSTPEVLGTVTYDEAVPGATYNFDYPLENTATAVACQDFTNTASVFSDDSLVLDAFALLTPLDTAQATATVCPQAGTWVIGKDSNVGDGRVPVGSNITYTLTAHKTGGVNPQNVVLIDNLSALAPYVDFPTFTAPAGQSVTFSGNVLTWTIDELGATDATLSFTVHVRSTAYGVDLPNLVTSVGSSNCPDTQTAAGHEECKTDNNTPPLVLPPVVSPPQVTPPSLPNTGGPNRWILAAGLLLLLGGSTLVAGDRRRRRRS
jgi:LPXTG-motif cell wall-anchored protein